jgi:hypothetical protein
MPKKTSNKRGKAPKPTSGSRSDATSRPPRDPATLRPPAITQNNPNDGTHPDPEVSPILSNEPSPPTNINRNDASNEPSPPINTNRNDAEPKTHSNQVPTNQNVPAQPTPASSDNAPSVKTVDSNDNTIEKSTSAKNEGDDAIDADENGDNFTDSNEERSESVPVANIQWDEYTYELAAEEHKSHLKKK